MFVPVQVCTACCEGNICNLALPRNETEAVFTTTSPLSDASTLSQSYGLTSALLALTFLTSTYI